MSFLPLWAALFYPPITILAVLALFSVNSVALLCSRLLGILPAAGLGTLLRLSLKFLLLGLAADVCAVILLLIAGAIDYYVFSSRFLETMDPYYSVASCLIFIVIVAIPGYMLFRFNLPFFASCMKESKPAFVLYIVLYIMNLPWFLLLPSSLMYKLFSKQ
jgi:hypothetical protein